MMAVLGFVVTFTSLLTRFNCSRYKILFFCLGIKYSITQILITYFYVLVMDIYNIISTPAKRYNVKYITLNQGSQPFQDEGQFTSFI